MPSTSLEFEDYPIREYVEGMARELAEMARAEGHQELAEALDGVVELAGKTPSEVS